MKTNKWKESERVDIERRERRERGERERERERESSRLRMKEKACATQSTPAKYFTRKIQQHHTANG